MMRRQGTKASRRQDARVGASTSARRGFTLIELMVVIGIIVILLGITVFAVAGLAKDSKQSSAVNTVQSALGKARALAMKRGEPVLIAFMPHVDDDYEHLQVVYAAFSGESIVHFALGSPPSPGVVDRFIPITGQKPEPLPRGIKVAAPWYAVGDNAGDSTWIAASSFNAIASNGEAPGTIVAVMFDRDGSVVTRNSRTDSARIYIDHNNDGLQHFDGTDYDPDSFPDSFVQVTDLDESYLSFAPFISVYDDDEAREFAPDVTQWSNGGTKDFDLTQYIDEFADRLHFNRYTGVVMR